ncbi:MAG: Mu homology domain-containing protein, partial [Olpidium bornovanus]
DADTPKFKATIGSVSYAPERSALIWKIKQFQGGKEFVMRAHFGLPSVKNGEAVKRPIPRLPSPSSQDTEKKQPISVKFEIPYFTVSGIHVRYLKIVEKSGYQALPWVRYITQNGGGSSERRKACFFFSSFGSGKEGGPAPQKRANVQIRHGKTFFPRLHPPPPPLSPLLPLPFSPRRLPPPDARPHQIHEDGTHLKALLPTSASAPGGGGGEAKSLASGLPAA